MERDENRKEGLCNETSAMKRGRWEGWGGRGGERLPAESCDRRGWGGRRRGSSHTPARGSRASRSSPPPCGTRNAACTFTQEDRRAETAAQPPFLQRQPATGSRQGCAHTHTHTRIHMRAHMHSPHTQDVTTHHQINTNLQ